MYKIERKTHNLDAANQIVGRLATKIATFLRGKNKPEFQAHIDGGDIVVVSNAKELKFTGKKIEQKEYYRHSGYPGGLKTVKMGKVFAENPAEVLKKAVTKMLPNNKLRNTMLKRLIIN